MQTCNLIIFLAFLVDPLHPPNTKLQKFNICIMIRTSVRQLSCIDHSQLGKTQYNQIYDSQFLTGRDTGLCSASVCIK